MAAAKGTSIVQAELVNVRPARDDDDDGAAPSVVDAVVDRTAGKVKRIGRKGEKAVRAIGDFLEDLVDTLDDDGRGPPPHVSIRK